MRMTVIHAVARLGIAFTWMWQGLVPKLLFANPDEKAMIVAAGLPLTLLPTIGALELVFAAAALVLWRWRPLFIVNALFMMGALVSVGLRSPVYLAAAFNPVTLNAGMILLSIIGYLAGAKIPSASRCLRRTPKRS
jgi:hypothetical protein